MEPVDAPTTPRAPKAAAFAALLAAALLAPAGRARPAPPPPPAPSPTTPEPFAGFVLPEDWETRYWASDDVKALLALSPRKVADLVPAQAGVRYCRCPACDAGEADDTLEWSMSWPEGLTCRVCGVAVPNDLFPAHDGKKPPPEEAVEVRPGVIHHYPYHEVEPERQVYPDERLYLAARRDDRVREFLAKAALYAAVRHHRQRPARKDPALARLAAVILVRFAQVYPLYATHFDQPGSPKYFDPADLPPPYRPGYRTAKWDWTGSRDVALNLVIAYAMLRGDPAIAEAGRLLDEPDPVRAVEHDLFRASAAFVRRQPEEFHEESLQADRGILAVGRLLNDPELVHDALGRLDRFAERGFYYDGIWWDGSLSGHRQVLRALDGWIDRLLAGYSDPPGLPPPNLRRDRRLDGVKGVAEVPMLALARSAGSALLGDAPASEVFQAAWPAPTAPAVARAPALLGGAGVARLALGRGDEALDVELRSLDALGPDHVQRQALRLAVGGRMVLGDLDEAADLPSGFDRASVSRNTVVVDGLNQRESAARSREFAPGGNLTFFAAEQDFQAVRLDDPRAYPQSTTRYRQTVVASGGHASRYAVSVWEVRGGLQHDQLFHAGPGSAARWQLPAPTSPGPETLLPRGLTYVSNARAEDGRWFVQAYGDFTPIAQARVDRPAVAHLGWPRGGPVGVRLHLLGDTPLLALSATTPDPSHPRRGPTDDAGRASLVLRRRSENGSTLASTFVTLFEPATPNVPALKAVGRVASPAGTVVLFVESADGPEHLVVNLNAGGPVTVSLADGRTLSTDGVAVRVSAPGLVLAGGTFASCGGVTVRQASAAGKIVAASRQRGSGSRGWFVSDTPLPDVETLAGRALLVRHGDGTTHGWTIERVENRGESARVYVREETGFDLDASGTAKFYQFPRTSSPGPHDFRVSRVARSPAEGAPAP